MVFTNVIERKLQEFDANSRAIKKQGTLLDSEARSVLSAVGSLVKNAELSLEKTRSRIESFQKKGIPSLVSHRQSLDEHIKRITGLVKTIQSKEDASDQNLTNVWTIVKEVQDRLANELSMWSGSTEDDIQTMCTGIEQAATANFTMVSVILVL